MSATAPDQLGELRATVRVLTADRDAAREARDAKHSQLQEALVETERLKAELARLTPSGQVAEDMELLRRIIAPHGDGEYKSRLCGALSRLAAKAQGYEAMKAESAARLALADMWKGRAATLEAERDALQAEKDSLTLAYTDACAERDAAVADNAARQRLGALMANACWNLVQRKALTDTDVPVLDHLRQQWDMLGNNPGAALLAEHAKALARARNEGLKRAANLILEASAWSKHRVAEHLRAMMEPES